MSLATFKVGKNPLKLRFRLRLVFFSDISLFLFVSQNLFAADNLMKQRTKIFIM